MINDKNIVLVESHYRSRSWYLALKNSGLTHIISVMPEEYKRFVKDGFESKNILNLFFNQRIKLRTDFEHYKDLNFFESKLNIKLNKIVNTDRTLRRKSKKYIEQYLLFLCNSIYHFFKKIKPKIIILEPTWTHELLICKFSNFFKFKIVSPVKDKILPDRLFFFSDELNHNFHKKVISKNSLIVAEKAIRKIRNNEKVQYFDQVKNRNKIDLIRLKILFRLIRLSILNSRNPNIQRSLFYDLIRKVLIIVKSKYQKFTGKFIYLNQITKPYIFLTLHLQPEATNDVVGQKYENQVEFIKNISQTVPFSYVLVVKEHPHSFGNRDDNFYKEVNNISNVFLLHPYEDSRKAIKNAKLVISNLGTISLEASIMKKPSLTATKMYFKKLMIKEDFDPRIDKMSDILKIKYKKNDIFLKNELSKIYRYSFEGNCSDFQTDINVLNEKNIKKLENSFKSIFKALV